MKITQSIPVLLLTSTLLLCHCSSNKESDTETIDANNPLSILGNADDIAENIKSKQEEAEKVLEDRRQRGDTLVLPYKELQRYLPVSISGYEKDGDPSGETSTQLGLSYSVAGQKYTNGTDIINVKIADYNQAQGAWQSIFSLAGMFSIENDDEKMGKFNIGIPKTTAVETYKKKTKKASVTVGTGYRFWIEVEAENQPDTEFLKSIAKSMELKKLSEM